MKREEEKYLAQFGVDIAHYGDLLHEAFTGVINEGVSNYPVFIFHQQDINVGIPIADRNEVAGNWSVNVSTLEEFYIKGLVSIDQVEDIKKKIAGDPPQFCCLVIAGENGSIIFLPRDEGNL